MDSVTVSQDCMSGLLEVLDQAVVNYVPRSLRGLVEAVMSNPVKDDFIMDRAVVDELLRLVQVAHHPNSPWITIRGVIESVLANCQTVNEVSEPVEPIQEQQVDSPKFDGHNVIPFPQQPYMNPRYLDEYIEQAAQQEDAVFEYSSPSGDQGYVD